MAGAPYLEVLEGSTSSASLQTLISFEIPKGDPVRLLELSLLPDSFFQSYGVFQIVVKGQTRQTTPKRLRQSFSVPFYTFKSKTNVNGEDVEGIVLFPGEKVEIKGNSDGTNTVTLSGSLLGEPIS